jgi:hypothetical protein
MSRHTIKKDAEIHVVVGWDRPLQSFFVDVYNRFPQDDEDDVLFTAGLLGPPFKIRSVEKLIDTTAVWAGFPEELIQILRDEQAGLWETNIVRDWTVV